MHACMYVCVCVYMYMRREEDAAEKIYRSVLGTDPGAVEGMGGRAGGAQRDLANCKAGRCVCVGEFFSTL
jgi:hypothetical protein